MNQKQHQRDMGLAIEDEVTIASSEAVRAAAAALCNRPNNFEEFMVQATTEPSAEVQAAVMALIGSMAQKIPVVFEENDKSLNSKET